MTRLGLACAAILGAAGCSGAAPVTALPDPVTLARPAEYSFGDATRKKDSAAERAANAILVERLGRRAIPDVSYWVASRDTDLAALRRDYDARAAAGGWRAVDGFAARLGAGRSGFAYVGGGGAFAILWLDAVSASGRRSVTVLRYSAEG